MTSAPVVHIRSFKECGTDISWPVIACMLMVSIIKIGRVTPGLRAIARRSVRSQLSFRMYDFKRGLSAVIGVVNHSST